MLFQPMKFGAALTPPMHFSVNLSHHLEMRQGATGDVGHRGAGDNERLLVRARCKAIADSGPQMCRRH